MISQRTSARLQAAKERGVKLGKCKWRRLIKITLTIPTAVFQVQFF